MTIAPQTQSIPLSRLVRSKSNVRHTARDRGIEALMASIAAHGLRQNLNVRPTSGGRFEVVAGARRLEALKRLMKDGVLESDAEIPCAIVANDDNAAEISLAENAVREAMHPDDQCTAFQSLADGGMGVDDVAARFGVATGIVRQRLKLASVSPLLRARFRKGDLDLSQMMAFALIDDHAVQEQVFRDLPDYNRGADAIRRSLTAGGVSATHRLARFVGIDAYEQAGGTLLRDLFDADQPAILTDAALVERLAMQKLEVEAACLKAEGWQWVGIELKPDYSSHYGRVYPQPAPGTDGDAYAAADLARAGARVVLDYDGELRIERGLLDMATMKAERRSAQRDAAPKTATLSEALVEDLTAHRTAALRLELARSPALALAAIVHALGLRLIYEAYDIDSCLDITGRSEPLAPHVKSQSECSAHAEFVTLLDNARASLPDDPAQFWDWCAGQDRDTLIGLLALLAGLSVDAIRRKGTGRSAAIRHADQLACALSLDMHGHWTPEPETFFSRLPKALMVQLLTGQDEPQHAAVVAKVKKAEAAQRTATTLLAKGWLPAPLLVSAVTPDDDRDSVDLEDDDDHRDNGDITAADDE